MIRWIGAAALMLVVACADEEAGGRSPGPGGPGSAEERVVPVETATVRLSSLSRDVTVSGVVEPLRTVGVNSQLSSTVLFVGAEEGDRVVAGQVLARLESAELQAAGFAPSSTLESASCVRRVRPRAPRTESRKIPCFRVTSSSGSMAHH